MAKIKTNHKENFKLCVPVEMRDKATLQSLVYPKIVQQKLDGNRCRVRLSVDDETKTVIAEAISRNQNIFQSVDHVLGELKNKIGYDILKNALATNRSKTLVIDGEIVHRVVSTPFAIINGLCNREQSDQETRQLVLVAYDFIWSGTSNAYQIRFDDLMEFVLTFDLLNIKIAPWSIVHNYNDLSLEIIQQRSRGAEGIVIKDMRTTDDSSRNNDWVKVKFKRLGTFKIIGWQYGKGRLAHSLGNIEVQDAEGNVASVGSGLSDDMRLKLKTSFKKGGEHSPLYAEIEYTRLTQGSVREPVFVSLREDFDEATSPLDKFKDLGEAWDEDEEDLKLLDLNNTVDTKLSTQPKGTDYEESN